MEYNPFSLKGKTILITGASSGIGKEISIECSKMGASLIITGRNEERLTDTFNKLSNGNHKYIQADLNDEISRKSLLSITEKIDGLVNSAGIMGTLPFKFIKMEKMEKMMKTNFFSPVMLTKELLTSKKINKKASIVYISSFGSRYAAMGNGLYAASKSAINGISKVLALELSAQSIRVNCILPAMIDSGIENIISEIPKDSFDADRVKYPFGYGTPKDVAYASIFFLSDASKWITGTDFIMDGGRLLGNL